MEWRSARVEPLVWVDEFWARFFGLEASIWSTSGLTVAQQFDDAGWRGMRIFQRGERWIVAAPADWIDRLVSKTTGIDRDSLLEDATLGHLVGDALDRCIGPVYHGYLADGQFRRSEHRAVRPIGASDAGLVETFALECGIDWEHGGIDNAPLWQHGYVEDGKLTALAGYRQLGKGIGDPCVISHPDHRNRGYGAAVVSPVVERALAAGERLLYRTLEANVGSVGIARRLGFERYGRSMVVRLRF